MLVESDLRYLLIAGCLLVAVVVAAIVHLWFLRRPQVSLRHLRGRSLRDARQVRESLSTERNGIRLGACLLPHRVAYGHLAVIGATGSGKTMLQRLLMQSALPRIGSGLGHRALVYDAKQDLLSLLAGMDVRAPIHLLNPLDARCAAWDIAADVTSPAAALQAATLLIPKATQDANPFFSNAARHLLHGVLLALISKAPKRWSLRHVILILRSEARLRQILSSTDTTHYLLQYFENAATFQNILSTILTRLAPFEIVAAAWDQADTRLSLRCWVEGESILVLGNDEDNRAAIDTINQLMFKRLSELILAQAEIEPGASRTTWFLLDEVRQAGRLDGLSAQMTKGRSKGAAVLLWAFMVGTRQMNALLDHCHQAGATLVLCGDARQLQSIEAGGVFRELSERFGAATLQEIKRQREPWVRAAVLSFAEGRASDALREFAGRGLVLLSDEPVGAMRQLLTDWKKEAPPDPTSAVILASRTADAQSLNQRVQEQRLQTGQLSGPAVVVGKSAFYIGDRIVFTRNDPCLGIWNGQTATITQLSAQGVSARLDSNRNISFSPRLYPHPQLAYALTTHKAQGMTIERAFVLVDETVTNREAAYVQASRAKDLCSFYAAAETVESVAPAMARSRPKVLATTLLPEPQQGPTLTLELAC